MSETSKNIAKIPPKSVQIQSPSAASFQRLPSEEISLLLAWIYGKSANTQRYCKRIVFDFLKEFPNHSLKEINIGHISVYLNLNRHLKPGSRNLLLATLSSLFKFLQLRKHIEDSPCIGIKSEKIPETWQSKVLNPEELTEMVRREPNFRNKLILRLLYLTGVRRSEVNKIRRRDFLLRSDQKVQLTVIGKGSKVRSILVSQKLWSDFKLYFDDNNINCDDDFVFPSKKSLENPITDQQIYVIVKKAAKRINKQASAHWLRHSSATHSIEQGAPLHVVQRTLGHESLATTGKYLNARPNQSNSDYLQDID